MYRPGVNSPPNIFLRIFSSYSAIRSLTSSLDKIYHEKLTFCFSEIMPVWFFMYNVSVLKNPRCFIFINLTCLYFVSNQNERKNLLKIIKSLNN